MRETLWARRRAHIVAALVLGLAGAAPHAPAGDLIHGERLDPQTYGPSWIETLSDAVQRDTELIGPLPLDPRERNGQPGVWMVPGLNAMSQPHSGTRHAVNKWGDTRMGIGFPAVVEVRGAWIAGQAGPGVWPPAVQAIGYRSGEVVAATEWFRALGPAPQWFGMDLRGVDRIEIVAEPRLHGAAWYALDDLTFTLDPDGAAHVVVVDFEDVPYDTKLTGSTYANLTWEEGAGAFAEDEAVPPPQAPPQLETGVVDTNRASDMSATAPSLLHRFRGVIRGDAGSNSYPPDTDGAIGPRHFVETVNRNFAIYDKATGAQLSNILLGAFLPGSNGDPRVLFDQYSARWFVIVTDFSATKRIFLAVSRTDDPTGSWFKTSFYTNQGADAGRWPDYPTLGVDANGVYTAAYMVGGVSATMTIFAIDKAPLVAVPPSLGTITAFRALPWEGAIQPAHTFGAAPGEYLVSWQTSNALRVRRIEPPLTAPTLNELGAIAVNGFSDPPLAAALGSSTPLDTVDRRLMMALYRDGSIWTCHTINVNSRAGCRWYELNPIARSVVQWGNVADPVLHFFFPSLMVNSRGDVVMGFTGSSGSQYPGCYYTGRRASDPPGEMAPPVQYQAGQAAYNLLDTYGRNRWGDYSYTTLDPVDSVSLWTIQEYVHGTNIWGTYVARLGFSLLGDLNCDGFLNLSDINPFVLALTDPAGYTARYPDCDRMNADCNGDGLIDFNDVNPFVALLTR